MKSFTDFITIVVLSGSDELRIDDAKKITVDPGSAFVAGPYKIDLEGMKKKWQDAETY